MRLSIIIPAINECDHIQRACRSSWEAGAHEVIAVDGGSRDGTPDIAAACGARVLSGSHGRAVQQNLGAREAAGDVLMFLHADNVPCATTADQIFQALQDPRVMGGAFRPRIESPRLSYRLLEWGIAWRSRWRGLPYGDQGLFFRREVFVRLGGFPEVPLMEDLMLMERFRRLWWPVLLPGPIEISPRRWERHGVLRQTLRNWRLLAARQLGASPESLARHYRRHDAENVPPNSTDATETG